MNTNDVKAAREALDSMDDYARMNTGVDAIGPRKVLEDFISMAEDFAVSVPTERAVSPAESVQSAEDFLPRDLAPTDAEQRLLKHAADESQKGYAEGRRSALEELAKEKERADNTEGMAESMRQFRKDMIEAGVIDNSVPPMFMTEAMLGAIGKEKERADRAEAALNQKRGPDERNEHPNLDVPIDLECSEKLDDLGDDRGQGLDGYWKWGFRAGWHYATKKAEEALLAQPLQQEGGKDAKPIEKERADFEEWYTTHAFDYEAAPIGSRDCALQWSAWLARSGGCYSAPSDWKVSPMPWGVSDNLQQASTSKAIQHYREGYPLESFFMADEIAELCEAMHEVTESDRVAHNKAKQRRSAAQAEAAKMECPTCGVDRLKERCKAEHWQQCPMTGEAQATPIDRDAVAAVQQKLDSLTVYGKSTAQATPEGAELPPLPHTTYNGYSDGSEPLYTADQMREYARATLAAITAAEPFAYCTSDRKMLIFADCITGSPEGLTPLYRAAPPQQEDTGGMPG